MEATKKNTHGGYRWDGPAPKNDVEAKGMKVRLTAEELATVTSALPSVRERSLLLVAGALAVQTGTGEVEIGGKVYTVALKVLSD